MAMRVCVCVCVCVFIDVMTLVFPTGEIRESVCACVCVYECQAALSGGVIVLASCHLSSASLPDR